MTTRRPPKGPPPWQEDACTSLAQALAARDVRGVVEAAWHLHYRELRRFLRDQGVRAQDLDDAVHDVFAQVLGRFDRFDGGHFEGWLFTLARYQGMTYRKRRFRTREHPTEDRLNQVVDRRDAGDPIAREELGTAVNHFREELDPINAIVFDGLQDELTAAEVRGRTEQELGVELTSAGVRNRRLRLRTLLTERLGKRDEP